MAMYLFIFSISFFILIRFDWFTMFHKYVYFEKQRVILTVFLIKKKKKKELFCESANQSQLKPQGVRLFLKQHKTHTAQQHYTRVM